MQVKGRYLVLGWTVVFLAVAGLIVTRDRRAFAVNHRLDSLHASIKTADGLRSDLQSNIARLSNRAVLGPKVEALGLRFASDSENVRLNVPRGR